MLRLEDFMTTDVETAEPDEAAPAAYDRMRRAGIHHLVVMRAREVIGVVSDRDLGGPRGELLRRNRTVGDLMSHSALIATTRTSLKQAANLLRGRSVGCLPVMNERGRLAGIVTVSDVLDLIVKGVMQPSLERLKRSAKGAGATLQ